MLACPGCMKQTLSGRISVNTALTCLQCTGIAQIIMEFTGIHAHHSGEGQWWVCEQGSQHRLLLDFAHWFLP